MTATWDGLGLRWTVGAGTEVTVEETGTGASHPPVLVLTGGLCVVTLVPPEDQAAWTGCAVFLRRLRDHAEDLAALLEARAGRRDRAQG
ncbi:hypothetical protein [Amycolatopsis rifamycinica]|uniref:Uncharacterized protein n=1 Tax=Amycolatopsis rifamycinica TaxID=287986 RepID=A0A066UGM2_9PSEU|nr:hypothetical protein [Amycolatopsis rifamycinica]KDN23309.1 hypothetical protein DV20_06215 [Amycolatopsis rifamycinica]